MNIENTSTVAIATPRLIHLTLTNATLMILIARMLIRESKRGVVQLCNSVFMRGCLRPITDMTPKIIIERIRDSAAKCGDV